MVMVFEKGRWASGAEGCPEINPYTYKNLVDDKVINVRWGRGEVDCLNNVGTTREPSRKR